MIEAIKWIAGDAWHYAWMIAVATFFFGIMVGSQRKTEKFQRKIEALQSDLDAVLTTITLKAERSN